MNDIKIVTHASNLDVYKRPPLPVAPLPPDVLIQEPTPIEMMANVSKAMLQWSLKGFPVVDMQVYDKRTAICNQCPHWSEEGNFGFGKCKYPKCGCTKIKRWIATEKCPIDKW